MASERNVVIDVDEFVRTRDALTTAFISLSSSVDKAVKAYIEHTNAVIAGDAVLNVSFLSQPFNAIKSLELPAVNKAAKLASLPAPVEAAAAGADEDDKGKKRKRNYKTRDPDAPKRPLTAYFRFLQEVRPILAAELAKSGMERTAGDVSRVATERWAKMSDEQKKPYHDGYLAAMEVYKIENEDYKTRTGQLHEGNPVAQVELPLPAEDSDDETDDEPAPPPPKVKKSSSPEAVKKTPKVVKKDKTSETAPSSSPKKPAATPKEKKDKVAASPVVTSTPMFNSINPAPAATSTKKRKSEAGDEVPKKKRGRPSKASLEAAAAEEDASVEPKSEKKDKPKKKKAAAEA